MDSSPAARCNFPIVCHDDNRHPALIQLLKNTQDFSACLLIERAGGFVREQQLRVPGDRARNRCALALPAGELGRDGILLFVLILQHGLKYVKHEVAISTYH